MAAVIIEIPHKVCFSKEAVPHSRVIAESIAHTAWCTGQLTVALELNYVVNVLSVITRWGNLPEESCVVSEIRALITTARQERATAGVAGCTPPYNPHAATAPPPTGAYATSPEAPPSCEC